MSVGSPVIPTATVTGSSPVNVGQFSWIDGLHVSLPTRGAGYWGYAQLSLSRAQYQPPKTPNISQLFFLMLPFRSLFISLVHDVVRFSPDAGES